MIKKMYDSFVSSHALDIRIEQLKEELVKVDATDGDAEKELTTRLEELIKLRDSERGESNITKIDLNSILSNSVGLISIAMILEYEKTDIIASKGLSIAQRLLGK